MNDKIKSIVVSFVFIIFILGVFIINLVKNDTLISNSERRKLALFPNITMSNLYDGSFTEDFDKYSMDQFLLREDFRKIKTLFEMKVFNKKDMNNVYLYDGYLVKSEYPLNIKSLNNASKKINNIINLYLNDKNNIYLSIIPDKNYFINKDNLKIDYNELVSTINKNIKAKYIDIFDLMELSDYYYTDTHWKQENLIKVAKRIGEAIDNKDIVNATYEKEKVDKFYGVLSGQLKLNAKDDYIYVLKNDVLNNAKVFNYEKNEEIGIYNYDALKGFDKYDIYLSGAASLLYIENINKKSKKELIVFRDSYGSSLIPLLVPGYKKITVIDTRYINPGYLKELVDFKDKDILFLYSAMLLNNSATLK